MKNFSRIFGGLLVSVTIFSTCSCSSRHTYFDAGTIPQVPRNIAVITPQDLVQAAQQAAASILQDKKMNNYLAEYKKQKGDPNAVPALYYRNISNQMDNPDLVLTPFFTAFESAIRNSKKYNLVQQSGSMIKEKTQKPDLIFSGTFYEQTERKGRTKTSTLLYVFKVTESKNNRLLWTLQNGKTNKYKTRTIGM